MPAPSFTKHQLTVKVLGSHGQCRLQVSGSSMLPTLWPGDTVQIERRPLAQLRIGDVVLYERDGRLFLHRLVDLQTNTSGATLITRGDAVPQDDPPFPTDCLLGVLAGVRRGNEYVPIPKDMSAASRLISVLLSRSSWLVRLLLRFWPRENSAMDFDALPEVPAA